MSDKSLKISVYGRVQGVNYRNSAQHKAQELGISGFAKNMPDGSVYLEAEGSESALNDFIDWCRKGPPMASVVKIETEESGPAGHTGFRVH